LQKDAQIPWEKLAEGLAVTRRTLNEWRKREDAPTSRDLAEWLAYRDKHGLGESGPKTSNGDLKAQKISEEVRRLKLINAKLERTSIDRDEVNGLLHHIAAQQRSALYQKMETELPPKLDGLPAAEIRAQLRNVADELCDIMATLVAKWEAE
jgi:DNA-binding Lrp family transcriptional regulator